MSSSSSESSNKPSPLHSLRQGVALAPDERESMDYDVVIVGAGPAGLACAIRLKQLAASRQKDLTVCVLEKGAEVGAHILSGAVIDPVGLAQLFPDWKEKDAPLENAVTKERLCFLTEKRAFPIPGFLLPPLMKNHGCYIASLGNLCRWLAQQAEALGVEIYTGFAAAELLINDKDVVCGVATGDMGVGKDSKKRDGWTAGVQLMSKYVVLAEGARGSLTKAALAHYDLDEKSDPQKFAIGIKELWQLAPEQHEPGRVLHTMGWPMDGATEAGSFIYHFGDRLASIGLVTHLDYHNPHLSPFEEFQRFKHHPAIRPMLEGGKPIAYGARAITAGGWQSVPQLAFPGGLLAGCAAGFVNLPRIKGSHNAIESGVLAADAAAEAVWANRQGKTLTEYEQKLRRSRLARELKKVRNVKPLLERFGTLLGSLLGGMDMWMRTLGLGLPFTLHHRKADHESLRPADLSPKITYPKPDGKISFDRLTLLQLSATNHEENQPGHLKLRDAGIPTAYNLPHYAEPAQLYCPAGVYEIVARADGSPRLQINAQNCVHCKTCDIKDPTQNINWIVPEGGGGPNYPNM